MFYNRIVVTHNNYNNLAESINKYYYMYKLISVVYNDDTKRYIAFLEKEEN